MPRPLLVLVSGHPGAGKTTLARALGDAMHLPHLNRDRIRAGMARTDPSSLVDPRPPWDVFAETIELFVANGVSLVADQTLYRGMQDEIRTRFVPGTSTVNLHCRSAVAYQRWLAKLHADPQVLRESIAELEARVQAQRDEITEPLDLGVPVIEVDTTDGYDPPLEVLVEEILRRA